MLLFIWLKDHNSQKLELKHIFSILIISSCNLKDHNSQKLELKQYGNLSFMKNFST